jgi:hypothetical protein
MGTSKARAIGGRIGVSPHNSSVMTLLRYGADPTGRPKDKTANSYLVVVSSDNSKCTSDPAMTKWFLKGSKVVISRYLIPLNLRLISNRNRRTIEQRHTNLSHMVNIPQTGLGTVNLYGENNPSINSNMASQPISQAIEQ